MIPEGWMIAVLPDRTVRCYTRETATLDFPIGTICWMRPTDYHRVRAELAAMGQTLGRVQ